MNLGATEYENQRNLYRQQVEKAKETYDPTDMAARQLTESFAPLIGTESTLTGIKQMLGRAKQVRNLAAQARNLRPNLDGRFSQAAQNVRSRLGINPRLPADAEDPIQMQDLDPELPAGINAEYPSLPEIDDPRIDQDEHDDGFDQGVKSVDDYARNNGGELPDPFDDNSLEGTDSFKMGAKAGQLARLQQYRDGAPLPDTGAVAETSSRGDALLQTRQVLDDLGSRQWNPDYVPASKLAGQSAVRAAANNNLKIAAGGELSESDLASETLPERPPVRYDPPTIQRPPTQTPESLGIDLSRHQQRLANAQKTLGDLDNLERNLSTVQDAGGDVGDSLSQLATNRAAVQAQAESAQADIDRTKAAMSSSGRNPIVTSEPKVSSDSMQEQVYHDGLEGGEPPESDGLLSSYAAGRNDAAAMQALKAARPALSGGEAAAEGTGAEGAGAAAGEGAGAGAEGTLDAISAGLDALGPESGGLGFVLGGLAAAGGAIAAAVAPKKSMAPPPLPNFTVPSFNQGLL